MICDTPLHKGQRVVTMATNFGTKIAVRAYRCISTKDNENVITYNPVVLTGWWRVFFSNNLQTRASLVTRTISGISMTAEEAKVVLCFRFVSLWNDIVKLCGWLAVRDVQEVAVDHAEGDVYGVVQQPDRVRRRKAQRWPLRCDQSQHFDGVVQSAGSLDRLEAY